MRFSPTKRSESGAILMAMLFIIAMVAAALATIYSVTGMQGHQMKRTVDRATAIAYGDGVVMCLFDQWRLALSTTQDQTQHSTGFTYNELMAGTATSPSTTIPSISGVGNLLPLKAPTASQLPVPAGLTLTSWSVKPADPYLAPLAGTTTRPTQEAGTNSRLRIRMYYVASAKVSYPSGSVTVERAFVRSGRNIFDNFLFSTQPVTEIHPGASMYVNGTIYAGGDLYTATNNLNFLQDVTYTGNWSIAYVAGDPHASTPSSPTWPTGDAPHVGAQQKLLDTPLAQLDPVFTDGDPTNDTDSNHNTNDDGYHEILEEQTTPLSSNPDPLLVDNASTAGSSERLAANADYRIYIDASNNVTIQKGTMSTIGGISGVVSYAAITSGTDYNAIMGAITTNTALKDGRENDNVRVVNVDVGKITTAVNTSSTTYDGVYQGGTPDGLLLYISDTSAGHQVTDLKGYSGYTTAKATGKVNLTTGGGSAMTSNTRRGIRLVNGGVLPNVGLTVASPNPVYVQGDYNTGSTTDYSSSPQSDSTKTGLASNVTNQPNSNGSSAYPAATSTPDETSGTYDKKASAIVADAVTILSNSWSDANSSAVLGSRTPTSTTVNAAIVAGNVPTTSTAYSGGVENFPRLLENWSGSLFLTIHGSFGLLYDSEQATGVWQNTGNYYNAPSRRWFYDSTLQEKNPPGFPVAYSYGLGSWTLK